METIIGFYAGMALLLIFLSVPMILEQVPPNRWYGFRTPRTLSDPGVWYPANRIAGQYLTVAAVFILIAAGMVSLFHSSLSLKAISLTMLTVSLTALAAATAMSFMALRRI
ncbi:MAG TPA: SdpI family protein [Pyrinomonadaceae bacterium]|nr:SdpI family protein [Pyrinomonadaceae bacterium]